MNRPIPLDSYAAPLSVEASTGQEIVVIGALYSSSDGAHIDALASDWSLSAPAGVDTQGIVDFAAGGLHVVSRDATTHEVHAVVTGHPGQACEAAGVPSPCLPLRLEPLAHSRHMTVAEWSTQVVGTLAVSAAAPPPIPPASLAPLGLIPLLAVIVALGVVVAKRARLRSAGRAWAARALRIAEKARTTDPILAAPLAPVLAGTAGALRSGSLDPMSPAGKRVTSALLSLETRIDDHASRVASHHDNARADRILSDIEAALEGADEARRCGSL